MVSGKVRPPLLDLANEDLVRSHVHAIWLAESGLSLGDSLTDILEVGGDSPSLTFKESVRAAIDDKKAMERTRQRAASVLSSIGEELESSGWYHDTWLDETLAGIGAAFDRACERWRELFRAASSQRELQNRIISDRSRSAKDHERATRLRAEAEAQLKILTDIDSVMQSDFYSYRYFASEGFLPGYNFPRLPISAYIPGRRVTGAERDEFLSRPRFLAISEFGPRTFIYHEGSRYQIEKIIPPLGDRESGLSKTSAKLCPTCGYLHPVVDPPGPDLCERCGVPLDFPIDNLIRMQNVSTIRRDRINSDEEERTRYGFEIKTVLRFAERRGSPSFRVASVVHEGEEVARITYGNGATLRRINLGWRRRKNKNQLGFLIDVESWRWARNDEEEEEEESSSPDAARHERVIPYVEDTKNCLLFEPTRKLGMAGMATLQAALKRVLQAEYQLEENELAVESLPRPEKRSLILIYESAEGGAGVLKRIVDEPQELGAMAAAALDILHFDPKTGEDRRRAPGSDEDCEAACYDCLLDYRNQPDHPLLDRHLVRDYLMTLSLSEVKASPAPRSRKEHMERLIRKSGSELERAWLRFLDERGLRLPTDAQVLIESCGTRPDFFYHDFNVVVYVDGPPHGYADRHARDVEQTEALEDRGYGVIRFGHEDDWAAIIARYPNVFGKSGS